MTERVDPPLALPGLARLCEGVAQKLPGLVRPVPEAKSLFRLSPLIENQGASLTIRQRFAESLPRHIVQVCISDCGEEALSKKLVVQDINNGDQW